LTKKFLYKLQEALHHKREKIELEKGRKRRKKRKRMTTILGILQRSYQKVGRS